MTTKPIPIPKCPCKGCTVDRHPGCHADCKNGYLEYKAYKDAEREAMRANDDAIRFKIAGCQKARANAHRHKPK